jgi:extradiol dioxygenase family protein
MPDWEKMRDRLVAAGTQFIIEPQLRFTGTIGEQAAMFFTDPSGNAIEFKAFKDPARLFAR